jgi:hypothetical protein
MREEEVLEAASMRLKEFSADAGRGIAHRQAEAKSP